MNCEKSQKRDLLTHWAIRNVNELGMNEVCKIRKRMMRKTLAEIKEFCASVTDAERTQL